MAEISTRIANITKNDSYAMRTLATMSILFLPGTFIAVGSRSDLSKSANSVKSFFSMSMFDWNAPKGMRVLSDRFWIYWAVTVPFTLLVLTIWIIWYKWHRKHESKSKNDPEPPILQLEVGDTLEPSIRKMSWRNFFRLAPITEKKEIYDKAAEETAIDVPPGAAVSTAVEPGRISFELLLRTDTVIQGPRR
jgi:hypothetical protein